MAARTASYCVKDCDLVERVVAKLCISVQHVEMSRLTGVCMQQLFDRGQGYKIILQMLKDERVKGTYIIPTLERDPGGGGKNSGDDKYEGAIVVEAKRGYYDEIDPVTGLECVIVILDFASLYPSIMRAHNQCYTTIFYSVAEYRAAGFDDADVEKTPDGCPQVWFLRAVDEDENDERRGILPVILKRLLDARTAVKNIMKARGAALRKLQHAAIAELLPDKVLPILAQIAGRKEALAAVRAELARVEADAGASAADKTDAKRAVRVADDVVDKTTKMLDKLVKDNEALLETHATSAEMNELDIELQVLDGRQLALKVSANSIYGFTGATVGA